VHNRKDEAIKFDPILLPDPFDGDHDEFLVYAKIYLKNHVFEKVDNSESSSDDEIFTESLESMQQSKTRSIVGSKAKMSQSFNTFQPLRYANPKSTTSFSSLELEDRKHEIDYESNDKLKTSISVDSSEGDLNPANIGRVTLSSSKVNFGMGGSRTQ